MIELTDISIEESDLGFLKKRLALAYSPTHSQLLVAAAPWRQELCTTTPLTCRCTGPYLQEAWGRWPQSILIKKLQA